MDGDSLFDEFNAGKDIQLSILLFLTENEIHTSVANVNTEWNALCKSTFNDNRFTYTFTNYFEKLMKLAPDPKSSSTKDNTLNTNDNNETNNNNNKPFTPTENNLIGLKLYVQCPWNRLWTYGEITRIDTNGANVKVVSKEFKFNPLTPKTPARDLDIINNENKNNNDKNYTNYNNADTDNNTTNNKVNENNIDSNIGNDNNYYYSNDDDKFIVNIGDKKVDLIEFELVENELYFYNLQEKKIKYFENDYHCIAPINTIDKYVKVHNKSKILELIEETIEKCGQKDRFNRVLIDLDSDITQRMVLWNGKHDDVDVVPHGYNNLWLCGIIDINLLNEIFPFWNDIKNDKYFQIPIFLDTTGLLYYEDRYPFEKFYSKFSNLYKYGNNRYFKLIWIDCNQATTYLAPFGTKSKTNYQAMLLTSPVMSNNKEITANVAEYDFMKESAVTVYEMYNHYLIDITDETATTKDAILDNWSELYARYPDKALVCCVSDNLFRRTALFKDRAVHKGKYEFGQMFATEKLNTKEAVDFPLEFLPFDENNMENIKMNDFFKFSTTFGRLTINFDLTSLIDQYDKQVEIRKQQKELISSLITDDDEFTVDEITLCLAYYKPRFVTMIDEKWDHSKWSGDKTNKKYVWMYRGCCTIQPQEWKIGIMLYDKFESKTKMTEYFYDLQEQCAMWIDITKEFDEMQNCLKHDWLLVDGNEEKDWDNRKYFMNVYWNKKLNRIFRKCSSHLDSGEVLPFYV